ncbi:MAG: DoxX family protein [Bdellovibrio sp.]|nr:DoxX family protein [Bdellovibrio sp.]
MNTTTEILKKRLWTRRVISSLAILFLLFNGSAKIAQIPQAVTGTTQLRYAISILVPFGIILSICTLLYAIPKTNFLGVILLTGCLGRAVATHVRLEQPLASHVLFPVYVGIFIWVAFYLRDRKTEALLSCRKN